MATVLIVEDQTQILALAQSLLEEECYKTLSAHSADDALVVLARPDPVDGQGGLLNWTDLNRPREGIARAWGCNS